MKETIIATEVAHPWFSLLLKPKVCMCKNRSRSDDWWFMLSCFSSGASQSYTSSTNTVRLPWNPFNKILLNSLSVKRFWSLINYNSMQFLRILEMGMLKCSVFHPHQFWTLLLECMLVATVKCQSNSESRFTTVSMVKTSVYSVTSVYCSWSVDEGLCFVEVKWSFMNVQYILSLCALVLNFSIEERERKAVSYLTRQDDKSD